MGRLRDDVESILSHSLSTVMAGLDPAIHLFARKLDRRIKSGDDAGLVRRIASRLEPQ
jgi:hypothetical protein